MKQLSIKDYFRPNGRANDGSRPLRGRCEDKNFVCEDTNCQFDTDIFDELIIHEHKIHKRRKNRKSFKVNPEYTFLCELCPLNPTSFHTKLDKIHHLASHHSRFMLGYCPSCKLYTPDFDYKNHAKYHQFVGNEDWLDSTFYPFQNLIKLLENQQFFCSREGSSEKCILDQPGGRFHCSLCGESQVNKTEHQNHINQCIFKGDPVRKKAGRVTTRAQKNNEVTSAETTEKRTLNKEEEKEEEGQGQGRGEDAGDGAPSEGIKPEGPSGMSQNRREIEVADAQSEDELQNKNEVEKRMGPIHYTMNKRDIQRGVGKLISFKSDQYNDDLGRMFSSLKEKLKTCIKEVLEETGQCKIVPNLITLFRKENPIFNDESGSLALTKLRHLLISAQEVNLFTNLDDMLNQWESQFEIKVDEFCENESGYYVLDFLSLQLKIFPFKSFAKVGQLKSGFQIPLGLAKLLGRKWQTKILCPQNSNNNDCILYCIALQWAEIKEKQALFPKKKLTKMAQNRDMDDDFLSKYCSKTMNMLKKKCAAIKFPLSLSKMWIEKFLVALNLSGFCINFFYYDDEINNIIPLHVSSSLEVIQKCISEEFGSNWKETMPERCSKPVYERIMNKFDSYQIDLLCYATPGDSQGFHCALILNFRTTVGDGQLHSENHKKYSVRTFKCRKCYISFTNIRCYFDHTVLCEQYNKENLTMKFPEMVKNKETGKFEPPKATFNESKGRERQVFHSVFDFETEFLDLGNGVKKMLPAMGFYFIFLNVEICEDDLPEAKKIKKKPFPHLVFEGNKCAEELLMHFRQNLMEARDRISQLRKMYDKCALSEEDELRVQKTTHCERCQIKFTDKGNARGPIRDHCHFQPNKLRAILCNKCNQNSRMNYTINFSGFNNVCFDNKIIIKAIFELHKQRTPFHFKISVIPLTIENYLSVRILVFCDSCHQIDRLTGAMSYRKGGTRCGKSHVTVEITDARKYWNTSLDALIESYSHEVRSGEKTAKEAFPMYFRYLENKGVTSFINFDSAIRKGYFPYDHWTASTGKEEDSFLSMKSLPSREQWHNSFWKEGEILGEKEYAWAVEIWEGLAKFHKSKGQEMCMRFYAQYYQISDVLLLSDIILSASNRYFNLFQLEILAFPSLASFSQAIFMNIMQKKGLSIELITNPDLYLMAKNACVGGICGIGEYRSITCNNPLLPNFNSKKPVSILKYFDLNSLYVSCMERFALPRGKYRFLTKNEIQQLFIDICQNEIFRQWTDEGYRSEIDAITGERIQFGLLLELTVTLTSDSQRERFGDLPLFEQKLAVPENWLSPYQKQLYSELGRKLPDSTQRIVLTLHEKTVHCDYRYLKYALELGYKIVSLGRVVEFEQYPFMRPYMNECIKMRRNSKTKVENQMAKNLGNIQFGKKLQSVEGRLDCDFIFSKKQLKKSVKCPRFLNFIEYDDEIGLSVKKRKTIFVDSLPLVGFTILSLSKLQFMKNIYSVYLTPFPAYRIQSKICYLDTDGVAIYHVLDKKEKNLGTFWQALRLISGDMDYSDFPLCHPLFSDPALSQEERNRLITDRENNKKKIGLFASEIGDRVVSSAAFIQPKSYCIEFADESPPKIAMKGARIQKLDLKMKTLKQFIMGEYGKHISYDHVSINGMKQELYIRRTEKNILNRLYTKRYMINGNRTLSYGHPLIQINELLCEMIDKVAKEN